MNINFRNIVGFEIIAPDVIGAETSEDIIITDNAINIFIKILNNYIDDSSQENYNCFIRLSMNSKKDSAKRYNISLDNVITDQDKVFELRKINIVIDRKSLFYYMGIIIDYISNDAEEGFVFLDISDIKVIDYYSK